MEYFELSEISRYVTEGCILEQDAKYIAMDLSPPGSCYNVVRGFHTSGPEASSKHSTLLQPYAGLSRTINQGFGTADLL